ncbi:MAG: hypothetical protein IH865_03590 [Chloroflexi bacterium]|nr:hypothetical protein [Chloroflexota bacterium]
MSATNESDDTEAKQGVAAAAKQELPEWAAKAHEDFIAHSTEIHDVLHLACSGMGSHRVRPDIIKFFAKYPRDSSDPQAVISEDSEELKEAERQAALAEKEIEKDFPLLHAQALVSSWSALEVYIESLLAAWIENEPSARQTDIVQRLKVRLWEYEQMDVRERCLYTVQLLQREVSGPLAAGATAFESQLSLFNLGGSVPDDIRRDLFEAHHLRNVLVHRRGIADRRLVEACPWLGLEIGQPILLGHQEFGRLSVTLLHYAAVVNDRVRAQFGMEPELPKILARQAERGDARTGKD